MVLPLGSYGGLSRRGDANLLAGLSDATELDNMGWVWAGPLGATELWVGRGLGRL